MQQYVIAHVGDPKAIPVLNETGVFLGYASRHSRMPLIDLGFPD